MIRRPPRSTRTDTLFPTRRSSDLVFGAARLRRERHRDSRGAPRRHPLLANAAIGRSGVGQDRPLPKRAGPSRGLRPERRAVMARRIGARRDPPALRFLLLCVGGWIALRVDRKGLV